MASADIKLARADWVCANPWLWALAGLGICLAGCLRMALLWAMDRAEDWTALPPLLVFVGLLATGAGLAIRLNSSHGPFLDRLWPASRLLVLQGLIVLFALVALTTTILLGLRILGVQAIPWKPGQTIILWLVVTPLSIAAASMCMRRLHPGEPVSRADEAAALLVLASLTVFCAFWALYDPDDPTSWDSIRLFLAILALVPLVAAPLVVAGPAVQRLFVTGLILLHFAAICTAVLSAPPTPWLVGQIWTRLARPYLEFMYLNNAYHFYAPEPGPASHLWFRLYYQNPDDPNKVEAAWHKIPDVDSKGRHHHAVALTYQRDLALTENTVPSDPAPLTMELGPGGKWVMARWVENRLLHSPDPPEELAKKALSVDKDQLIPLHPLIVPYSNQYLPPNAQSRDLLSSYARHACRIPHPRHKDWQIKSVRIYRVIHMIIPLDSLTEEFHGEGLDPRDPVLYRPFYLGRYDPQGKLLDPDSPFLYWLLPNLRYKLDNNGMEVPPDKEANIRSWALKHADDPAWILVFDKRFAIYRAEER